MTGAVVKQAEIAQAETAHKSERQKIEAEETKEEQRDIIGDYLDYLSQKKELTMEVDE